jgi:hypothetical protein
LSVENHYFQHFQPLQAVQTTQCSSSTILKGRTTHNFTSKPLDQYQETTEKPDEVCSSFKNHSFKACITKHSAEEFAEPNSQNSETTNPQTKQTSLKYST